jgi:hypothetical protein
MSFQKQLDSSNSSQNIYMHANSIATETASECPPDSTGVYSSKYYHGS